MSLFSENDLNYAKKSKEEFSIENNVIRWKSNNNIPPKTILYSFLHLNYVTEYDVENSLKVYQIEMEQKLKEYKEMMKTYIYSDEELYEMKAAFGKGTTVVNVISGSKIQL